MTGKVVSLNYGDSDREDVLEEARCALLKSNARAFDGDDNFKKCLVITTAVVGPEGRSSTSRSNLAFEAKVPRSAVNDLMMSATWSTNTPAEAASFLRELADLIAQAPIDPSEDDEDEANET